jgi:hypothetical protein
MANTFKPQNAPLKENTLIYILAHPSREVPGPRSQVVLLSAACGSSALHAADDEVHALAGAPRLEDDRRAGMTCARNWLVRRCRRRRGVKRRARLVF